MRNGLTQAAPETPRQGVSGVFAATGENAFELFHYINNFAASYCDLGKEHSKARRQLRAFIYTRQ